MKYVRFGQMEAGVGMKIRELKRQFFQLGSSFYIIFIKFVFLASILMSQSSLASLVSPWMPTGADQRARSVGCQRYELKLILKRSQNIYVQARELQRWLDQCDNSAKPQSYNRWLTLLKLSKIKYHVSGNSAIRRVKFTLPSGITVRGLLGMHGSDRLPLIIARCGIYCDAESGIATSQLFMHLFEESPFHLLVLSSSSGKQFAADNGSVVVSGIEEGAQTLEIAEAVRNSDVRGRISDIHLFGVSLGGHGTLFASKLAKLRPDLGIRSAIAACPVVDLEKQIQRGTGSWLGRKYLKDETNKAFQEVAPLLTEFFNTDPASTFVASSIDFLRSSRASMSRFVSSITGRNENYWKLHRFQDWQEKPGIPSLVLHAQDDGLVPSEINSSLLRPSFERDAGSVGVVGFNWGSHCAFELTSEWSIMSEIYRSYFISYSTPSAELNGSPVEARIAEYFPRIRGALHRIGRVGWRVDGDMAQITVGLFDPGLRASAFDQDQPQSSCDNLKMQNAPPSCFSEIKGRLPLRAMASLGIPEQVSGTVEANRIERFLNTQTEVLTITNQGKMTVIDGRNQGMLLRADRPFKN